MAGPQPAPRRTVELDVRRADHVGRLIIRVAGGRHGQALWPADRVAATAGRRLPITLRDSARRAMCGIVGYAGSPARAAGGRVPQALDVVMEGLRRLEYRGYDSAGVALVTDAGLVTTKRAGKLAHLQRGPGRRAAAAPRPPASATPAGPPTARRPTSTRTRTVGGSRRGRADPQRHHRELRRAQGGAHRRGRQVRSPRPTPRWPRTCSPPRMPSIGDLAEAMRSVRTPARGRVHPPRRPRRRARRGRRRPPQLPARRRPRRGRELPRLRRRRVHRAHPRRGRARPGPGRDDHRRTA